jgi:hypothetical protein
MKKLFFLLLMGAAFQANAQTPEDAIRLSWFAPNGTPRSNALGGAMGSLGGDLSATSINPAGLGFYKSNEFYISPNYISNSNQFNYFGNKSSIDNSKMNIGSIGLVFADENKRSKYKNSNFSISFTKIADYNNSYSFRGQNNYSSYLEKYADQLYYDGASLTQAQQNYIYGSSLAYWSKLVTPVLNANKDVTDYQAIAKGNVNQFYDATTTGSYNEMSFTWASNLEDKLYLGGAIVMPMINYSKSLNYTESYSSNNQGLFDFYENYSSKGFGIGAKLGLIYKPEAFFRMGLTVHTPQLISFSDAVSASMFSNEFPGGISSGDLKNQYPNNFYPKYSNYTVTTPTKAILSGSYFFASPSKPTQPLGFISADLEFVNYAGTKYYTLDNDQSVVNYYQDLNTTIKNNYKNAINFKIGSEIKLTNAWLARAGAAYYGSPYKDNGISASHMSISGGLGYRMGNQFVDFTVVSIASKDAIFPYRLIDKDNYYAEQKSNRLILSIGYGIKF